MARKKTAEPLELNGTGTEAVPQASTTAPQTASTAPGNGNDTGGRKPLQILSFQVGVDSYVQASIWDRVVRRKDGTEFTTYDVSVRKRYLDASGEWKTLYSFHPSEIYALIHALNQATAAICELRTAAAIPF